MSIWSITFGTSGEWDSLQKNLHRQKFSQFEWKYNVYGSIMRLICYPNVWRATAYITTSYEKKTWMSKKRHYHCRHSFRTICISCTVSQFSLWLDFLSLFIGNSQPLVNETWFHRVLQFAHHFLSPSLTLLLCRVFGWSYNIINADIEWKWFRWTNEIHIKCSKPKNSLSKNGKWKDIWRIIVNWTNMILKCVYNSLKLFD